MKRLESILYIEDELNVQQELKVYLELKCDNLYLASNGIEGFDLYIKHKPQLVISDIQMPKMDGIELTSKIRERNKNQKILLLTAFNDTNYLRKAINLQVMGYLIKPLDLDQLEEQINHVKEEFEIRNDLYLKEQMLIQQSKLAAMGEMISNISHQLKQPLSIISLLSSSISYRKELHADNETTIKYADDIFKQVEHISQTIDDFKNFLKPCNDEKCFNIKSFLEKCINLVNSSYKASSIDTITEIDEKINAYGNPNYLIQAIINILNNAKDALDSAKDIIDKLVFIFVVKKIDDYLVIEIKDNAGGIPKEVIEKIFDPYFTTKGELKGTGIGLYMTKTIITEKLNGTIEVTNSTFEHQGATYTGALFKITLPITYACNL